MTTKSKRLGQHADETAMEYLRRVVGWANYETETLLDALPSVEAVLEFFELWHAYDTDFWSGVIECIADGDDPAKARAFVKKWGLPKDWSEEINEAVEAAKLEGCPKP